MNPSRILTRVAAVALVTALGLAETHATITTQKIQAEQQQKADTLLAEIIARVTTLQGDVNILWGAATVNVPNADGSNLATVLGQINTALDSIAMPATDLAAMYTGLETQDRNHHTPTAVPAAAAKTGRNLKAYVDGVAAHFGNVPNNFYVNAGTPNNLHGDVAANVGPTFAAVGNYLKLAVQGTITAGARTALEVNTDATANVIEP